MGFEETFNKVNDEERLAKEIERLRKEGSRLLEEEQELLRQQIKDEESGRKSTVNTEKSSSCRIKVRWDKKSSCQYSKDQLEKIFSKYGNVTAVVLNEKKGGSALVEFDSLTPAKMAVNIESGFSENKLKLKGLWEESISSSNANIDVGSNVQTASPSVINTDFESLVMRKLRQEEERK